MTSSSLPLHGPKRGQSKAGWLYELLRFCVKQHMPLIFCQPTAVADGTLHAQCPGAKQVPLAINAIRKCFAAPGWLTAHCCVLWQAAATHLYWLIYPTEGTKLLVWAPAPTLQTRPSCILGPSHCSKSAPTTGTAAGSLADRGNLCATMTFLDGNELGGNTAPKYVILEQSDGEFSAETPPQSCERS